MSVPTTSSQPEVARLVPGDTSVQVGASTSSAADAGGSGGAGGGGGQLAAPNHHTYVGRTPSTSSCTRSLRSTKGYTVHITEPPRDNDADSRPPTSSTSGPPAAASGDDDTHGPLHHAIPVMPLALAISCCVMNILLPGIGQYRISRINFTTLTEQEMFGNRWQQVTNKFGNVSEHILRLKRGDWKCGSGKCDTGKIARVENAGVSRMERQPEIILREP